MMRRTALILTYFLVDRRHFPALNNRLGSGNDDAIVFRGPAASALWSKVVAAGGIVERSTYLRNLCKFRGGTGWLREHAGRSRHKTRTVGGGKTGARKLNRCYKGFRASPRYHHLHPARLSSQRRDTLAKEQHSLRNRGRLRKLHFV